MNKPHPSRAGNPLSEPLQESSEFNKPPADGSNTTSLPATETPKKRKPSLPTDPVLLAVARLERVLEPLSEEMRYWACEYLRIKYGKKPEPKP